MSNSRRHPHSGRHPHPEALYYHIAIDALEVAKAEAAKAKQDDSTEFKRKEAVTTTMVFSALCLEAFINQEYAQFPETSKVLEDNDYIRLESKWLMLPLLLGSKVTFNTGTQPYQTFRELVKTRNQRLVHFKPAKETQTAEKEYKEEYLSDFLGNIDRAKKYIECVKNMIKELHRLTGSKTTKPNFLTGAKYTSRVWSLATAYQESL